MQIVDTELTTNTEGKEEMKKVLPSTGDDKESNVVELDDMDIALLGNGNDEELSMEQREMIDDLYKQVSPLVAQLVEKLPGEADFCDHETCRRYLVARQWKLSDAQAQLTSTLQWRMDENPAGLDFWQSPKALENPLSLSMRIVGWDVDGRPIAYTCYAEAHDRWDVEANMKHMTLLMEATCRLLHQRRKNGKNGTASSRQWVWVVDFDGFGWRDQSPKSGILTAKLMQHYPEMLHLAVLINAPKLFAGAYKLIRPVLDDRVRKKVLFQNSEAAKEVLQQRLGTEAAEWILAETKDNQAKRNGPKPEEYWVPPKKEGDHDARGMASYVESPFYIKSPGDAYREMKNEQR